MGGAGGGGKAALSEQRPLPAAPPLCARCGWATGRHKGEPRGFAFLGFASFPIPKARQGSLYFSGLMDD